MKIAVIGYSGSGKSTLSEELGKVYALPVLHLDTVHWLPGWQERVREEELAMVGAFMAEHDGWVIDGNYSKLYFDRRMAEADLIVFMNFNRFSCLHRAFRRLRRYRGKTRPSITVGCPERIDREFFAWLLYKGRSRTHRERYRRVLATYPEKVVVIKNQRRLDAYRAAGYPLR